mmetsp:Transcript_103587/g.259788  ORF Transcript_103587/g.259788 Transcript_103587/m.259788 type:complete len:168 (+) Transcript_103587:980-1483(+)
MMPETQRATPSQWKASSFLRRKMTANSAAKTISAPRSNCQTLAGMYKKPIEHRPVAKMSKTAGIDTILTFLDHDIFGSPFGASSIKDSYMPLDLLYMLLSNTNDNAIAKNMMNVMNHGFWNTCSCPDRLMPFMVKAIFMVIVFNEPQMRSPKTEIIVKNALAILHEI